MAYQRVNSTQWVDTEKQTFFTIRKNDIPFFNSTADKKKITTTYGVLNVYTYREFMLLPENSIGIIIDFCEHYEKIKKTIYAKFVDFQYISIGKRPIKGEWIDFNFDFEPWKAYMMVAVKENDYPAQINIKKSFVIKE